MSTGGTGFALFVPVMVQKFALLFTLLLSSVALLGCPQHLEDTETRAKILIQKEYLREQMESYSHICYRPGTSRDVGATDEEMAAYSEELWQEALAQEKQFIDNDDALGLYQAFEAAVEKYSDDVILACARQNFLYITPQEQQWFDILDNPVYATEASHVVFSLGGLLREKLLESDMILVGNSHIVGDLQGKILLDLADYLTAINYGIKGILTEAPYDEKRFIDMVTALQEQSQSLAPVLSQEELFKVADKSAEQVLKEIFDNSVDAQTTTLPVWKAEMRFAALYHQARILPVDFRFSKENKQRLQKAVMDGVMSYEEVNEVLSTVVGIDQRLFFAAVNELDEREKWFVYYGSSHLIDLADYHENDRRMMASEYPDLNLFSVTQLTPMGVDLPDKSMREDARLAEVFYKYGFPSPPISSDNINKHTFQEFWIRFQEKHNVLHNRHSESIYVNMLELHRDGELAMFDNILTSDLLVIGASRFAEDEDYSVESDPEFTYLRDEYLTENETTLQERLEKL